MKPSCPECGETARVFGRGMPNREWTHWQCWRCGMCFSTKREPAQLTWPMKPLPKLWERPTNERDADDE